MASQLAAGKTVIVTGAGGGLGKAIATGYLQAGANVVICDVSQIRLTATEEEWSALYPGKFLALATDVTSESAVQKLVSDTVAKFGRLDVLVNNAGIMDDFSAVGECSTDMFNKILAVNIHGPFNTSKAAVTQFKAQASAPAPTEGGLIINIGSLASKGGFHAGAAYTVSKHGLVGLSKNTASAYGPQGIYSVALLIGGMADTNLADCFAGGINMDLFQRIQAAHTKFDPETHSVPLENIAKYCVFLTDRGISKAVNGSCIDFSNNWPEA